METGIAQRQANCQPHNITLNIYNPHRKKRRSMKTRFLFVLALMISFASSAQFQLKRSKSLLSAGQSVQWADINNDSLLDAIISLKKNNYLQLIAINQIATDTAKTYVLADSISSDG